MNKSKLLLVSESFDGNGVVLEGLENIAGVGDISCSLVFLGCLVSVSEDFLSGYNVFLHHFTEKDVIDLDIMC